jgi:ADP-heptose:LPS heptosyltransferase
LLGSKIQEKGLIEIKNKYENIEIAAGSIVLKNLYSYLLKTKLFIGLDSGISHMALKAGAKSIILVGGGTYGMYFPKLNDKKTVYLSKELSCFQCNWNCIYDRNLCLSDISVEEVMKHIEVIYENP